ncbi:hypothetical protein ABFU82_20890 [Nocardioides sp. WV_118_6]
MSAPGAVPPPPSPSPSPSFPAPGYPGPGSRSRSPMVLRHLISAVVALVLTPIGIMVFDYGSGKYLQERARTFDNSNAAGELVLLVLGALILLAVAVTARVSGLGPVLAGLVWGGIPFVWFVADLPGFYEFAQDLPSTHFWFTAPSYLFPLVGTLLVGAGLAGAWRGRLR